MIGDRWATHAIARIHDRLTRLEVRISKLEQRVEIALGRQKAQLREAADAARR